MRILHFLLLLFFSALVAKNACSQDPSEITDSLFQRKLPELGLHQFKRTCKTGKEEFTVIQVFNSKGQRIEQLSHNASGWTREKQTFDENGNPKMSIYFNEHDTSSIATTLVYTYANPLDYKVEIFDKGIALRETFTYQTRETKDTIWVTKTHKTIGNDHIRKTLNRTTQRGDSLTLSEFVKFDERGKIANVEAYFETKRKDQLLSENPLFEKIVVNYSPIIDKFNP